MNDKLYPQGAQSPFYSKWVSGVLTFYRRSDHVAFYKIDATNLVAALTGDGRLDLSSCTVAAANTDGGVIKAGTSSVPVTEDTASMKFVSMYFDCGATSGDAQGMYVRLYLTGAGGGGDALRAFCSVTDVAGATARGAHISLSFGTTGSITGLGCALETTLHVPSGGGMAGTCSSIKAAIHCDGAGSDPAGATALSVFNIVSQGNATGMADVDDDCDLFDIDGFSAAADTTQMISSVSLAELPAGSIGIRISFGGNKYYIPAVIAAEFN